MRYYNWDEICRYFYWMMGYAFLILTLGMRTGWWLLATHCK